MSHQILRNVWCYEDGIIEFGCNHAFYDLSQYVISHTPPPRRGDRVKPGIFWIASGNRIPVKAFIAAHSWRCNGVARMPYFTSAGFEENIIQWVTACIKNQPQGIHFGHWHSLVPDSVTPVTGHAAGKPAFNKKWRDK